MFESLTPVPPMADAPIPPVYLSVETVLNIAALLLVISLGCSMLVPSEPGWSDDDDVFFLGSATAAPAVFEAEPRLMPPRPSAVSRKMGLKPTHSK